MITIDERAHTRTITDDTNPRVHFVEHRCARCRDWVPDDDTVWVPNWSAGKPYHVDCAPEGDEE